MLRREKKGNKKINVCLILCHQFRLLRRRGHNPGKYSEGYCLAVTGYGGLNNESGTRPPGVRRIGRLFNSETRLPQVSGRRRRRWHCTFLILRPIYESDLPLPKSCHSRLFYQRRRFRLNSLKSGRQNVNTTSDSSAGSSSSCYRLGNLKTAIP